LAVAETQTWQIDPNHTASQFSVRHLGISTVRGQFMKTSGTVGYDPADLSKTQIDVTIDASSVDTRVQMRDNDLRSDHFLDVEGPSEPTPAMGGIRMGAEATTKINRKDFGVNGAAGVVGDDIQITLDVELTRPAK